MAEKSTGENIVLCNAREGVDIVGENQEDPNVENPDNLTADEKSEVEAKLIADEKIREVISEQKVNKYGMDGRIYVEDTKAVTSLQLKHHSRHQ